MPKLNDMKIKTILLLMFSVAVLAACKDEDTHLEKGASVTTPGAVLFENKCKALSIEGGNKQVVVFGKVLKSGLSLPSVVECDSGKGDCSKHYYRSVFAMMKSLPEEEEVERAFIVNTNPENPENIVNKPLYFEHGKKYKFCARYLPNLAKYNGGKNVYRVDFVETISELE